MKVVAFNSSARKDGNTARLILKVFEVLEAEGIDCELIQLAGKQIGGCIACYKCYENKDRRCAVTKDSMNEIILKMDEADGIILGSPSYIADMSANMKAIIERTCLVSRANDNMLRRKVGAPVVAKRRGGATHVISSINFFFLISEMIIPGSNYWNFGIGKAPGDVEDDIEGIETMNTLGINMAWLLKKINQ
jgi:multimeric flavodoxin WrbA